MRVNGVRVQTLVEPARVEWYVRPAMVFMTLPHVQDGDDHYHSCGPVSNRPFRSVVETFPPTERSASTSGPLFAPALKEESDNGMPVYIFPALATVGDADEEMVEGMVDDAQRKIAADRVIRYYDAGVRVTPGVSQKAAHKHSVFVSRINRHEKAVGRLFSTITPRDLTALSSALLVKQYTIREWLQFWPDDLQANVPKPQHCRNQQAEHGHRHRNI
jgi:hypothetical protein